MTKEEAKRIIKAFGPCTQTYECMTPDDLCEMYPVYDATEVAQVEFDCEDIRRDLEFGFMSDAERDSAVEEWREQKREICDRLRAEGFEVN